MSRYSAPLALILAVAGVAPAAAPPAPRTARAAVDRALPLLVKGAKGHVARRTCFACHNQAQAVLALTTARGRGLTVRDADLKQQLDFIAAFLGRNRDNYRKGSGQGGQADTAGYALLTLEWGGHPSDKTTDAVAEYLLLFAANTPYWRTVSFRPPSEASRFTTTYLALRGLRKWGTPEQKTRIAKRSEAARAWLLKTAAKDTEDRVFRLLALREAGASSEVVRAAANELIDTQRKDGGWGQLERLDSDAYATGSALVALHEAGALTPVDGAYRRGVAFLLRTQKADGSWLVRSRSRPFQTYYESGFPHGKDQFISMAATGWAATALALTLPERPR